MQSWAPLNQLELNRDLGRIDKGIQLAQEVEIFMTRFDKILSNDYRILFHYQLGYIYFADAKYSAALKHLNKILDKRGDPRADVQSYGRVLNLMVHHELKNYDLIEYLCRSTRRFLNKKNRLYAFEKTILDFFRQVSRTHNIDAIKNLKALKRSIQAIEEDQSEPLDFINVLIWIRSKLNRDTFKNTLSTSDSK